jgi:hypothetical protein
MVIEGDSYALTRATTAILVELLKQMDGAKKACAHRPRSRGVREGTEPWRSVNRRRDKDTARPIHEGVRRSLQRALFTT